jgi:hypothetical protein
MTLPASGSITLGDVAAELGIGLPLSLGDARVLALAGKSAPPISLSDLYGKSAAAPMSGSIPNSSGTTLAPGSSPTHTETVSVSINVQGGVLPLSYAWSHVTGDGSVTAVNGANTSASFTVSRFAPAGTIYSQVVQCVVTDSTGAQLVRQGTVTLELQ